MQIISNKPLKVLYKGSTLIKNDNWCVFFTDKDDVPFFVPLTPWYNEEVEQSYNKLRQQKLERICK